MLGASLRRQSGYANDLCLALLLYILSLAAIHASIWRAWPVYLEGVTWCSSSSVTKPGSLAALSMNSLLDIFWSAFLSILRNTSSISCCSVLSLPAFLLSPVTLWIAWNHSKSNLWHFGWHQSFLGTYSREKGYYLHLLFWGYLSVTHCMHTMKCRDVNIKIHGFFGTAVLYDVIGNIHMHTLIYFCTGISLKATMLCLTYWDNIFHFFFGNVPILVNVVHSECPLEFLFDRPPKCGV